MEEATIDAYGLGTMQFTGSDGKLWGHTGDIIGFASIGMYDSATGIAVAVLANQGLDEDVKIAIAKSLLAAAGSRTVQEF